MERNMFSHLKESVRDENHEDDSENKDEEAIEVNVSDESDSGESTNSDTEHNPVRNIKNIRRQRVRDTRICDESISSRGNNRTTEVRDRVADQAGRQMGHNQRSPTENMFNIKDVENNIVHRKLQYFKL
ncbi:uncharacterized protein LOC107268614 isoform X2 [Cephus cinctus]|uniref:Uncharacterized protein LOC107268614 isoform X2 n=1 Tax=Cephus cinctus TaxID=211228 RepID=A0AAJ7BYI0_CEPCN|nr:uncharacterized protein LOC107268614 isoform X2 [Cephus cinctus]